jgi:hypothetical protein
MIVSTEGDMGDAVLLLGIMSKIPDGPHSLLLQSSATTKMHKGERFDSFVEAFSPLAKSQPYINECRPVEPGDVIDWKSAEFRKVPYRGLTLLGAHLSNYNETMRQSLVVSGCDQWLHGIKKSKETKDVIVINRTGRYRNWTFPWMTVVRKYKHRLMFVGLEHEWKEFCGHFGYVEFRRTSNLLEVAELIAGSLLFIGNQSCANAIAEGLKHPMIQETDLEHPDCIFKRSNAQHVPKGHCVLPGFDGDEDEETEALKISTVDIDTSTVPPGGWQYQPDGDYPPITSISLSMLIHQAKAHGATRQDVLDQNIRRNYEYFFRLSHGDVYHFAEEALRAAGIN